MVEELSISEKDVSSKIETNKSSNKICCYVTFLIVGLVILGVAIFLIVYFLTQGKFNFETKFSIKKSKIILFNSDKCHKNAYNNDNNTCACKYGFSGDGVNYCDGKIFLYHLP